MSTQQPEALRLAEQYDHGDPATHGNAWKAAVCTELRRQHARIAELEEQIEAIGAGGVNGPLIGQPQAMPDLSQLTERGAKAWAGVDAQGLRDGGASHSSNAGQATAAQPAAQQEAAYAALPDEREMLKHALWLASSFTVHRYLMSNAEGRWSGAEKAACHDALCRLHVAVFRGVEVDRVRVDFEEDWVAVHDATQELTDHMDVVIGFPLKGVPDYEALAPKFFAYFHRLATHTLRASNGQAPAGAGEAAEHYRNAIARARLLDSDLSNLTERGAKAWAGVDAQGLRDGGASPSANAGEPSGHIKEPYTLAEIKAKIASNDYSAEMLLQHAMLLLDSASLAASAGEPVAWLVCTEEGDPDMVFLDRLEACQYCEDDDPPKPLYLAAPPTAQAEGWRLIETAPQDGRTLLLGYFNSAGKWRTIRGEWLSQDHIYEYAEDPDCMSPGWHETTVEDDDGKCWPIDPTHWMPLPAAPGPADGERNG